MFGFNVSIHLVKCNDDLYVHCFTFTKRHVLFLLLLIVVAIIKCNKCFKTDCIMKLY